MSYKSGGKVIKRTREKLWNSQPRECFWCQIGLTYKEATLDHVVPRTHGGTYDDCVLACWQCNHERGILTEIGIYKERAKTSKKWMRRLAQAMITCSYRMLKAKWDKIHKERL